MRYNIVFDVIHILYEFCNRQNFCFKLECDIDHSLDQFFFSENEKNKTRNNVRKAELPHPIFACIFCIMLHFGSSYFGSYTSMENNPM